jgi:hypothetical protein
VRIENFIRMIAARWHSFQLRRAAMRARNQGLIDHRIRSVQMAI